MTTSDRRHRSAPRREPSYRIRAIRRDPLDPRLLARLFIQLALDCAEAERTHTTDASRADSNEAALHMP